MEMHEIETPAMILDYDAFENNLIAMDGLLAGTSMKIRPHYKSHRCPKIAGIQLQKGAQGITCAKLGEAIDLVNAGVENVLIANQIVQPSKIKTLAELALRCYLIVCVDNADNLAELSKAARQAGSVIHCLVEFEVGMRRCGVDSYAKAYELAMLAGTLPNLAFDGIQAYAGHIAHETSIEARTAESTRIETLVSGLKQYLTEKGLPINEVGGVSTGTVELRKNDTVYTHIQPGSYIFMDAAYRRLNLGFRHSLYVLTTVVSTNSGCVVTDTGVKSLGMDQGNPTFVGIPEETEISMSEEHGAFYMPNHGFRINDKIRYIPGHCCTTVNMYEKIYVVKGGNIVDIWDIVSRGKSR